MKEELIAALRMKAATGMVAHAVSSRDVMRVVDLVVRSVVEELGMEKAQTERQLPKQIVFLTKEERVEWVDQTVHDCALSMGLFLLSSGAIHHAVTRMKSGDEGIRASVWVATKDPTVRTTPKKEGADG